MLLYHLGQQHPDQVGPSLERIRTEYIATVVTEAVGFPSELEQFRAVGH